MLVGLCGTYITQWDEAHQVT